MKLREFAQRHNLTGCFPKHQLKMYVEYDIFWRQNWERFSRMYVITNKNNLSICYCKKFNNSRLIEFEEYSKFCNELDAEDQTNQVYIFSEKYKHECFVWSDVVLKYEADRYNGIASIQIPSTVILFQIAKLQTNVLKRKNLFTNCNLGMY